MVSKAGGTDPSGFNIEKSVSMFSQSTKGKPSSSNAIIKAFSQGATSISDTFAKLRPANSTKKGGLENRVSWKAHISEFMSKMKACTVAKKKMQGGDPPPPLSHVKEATYYEEMDWRDLDAINADSNNQGISAPVEKATSVYDLIDNLDTMMSDVNVDVSDKSAALVKIIEWRGREDTPLTYREKGAALMLGEIGTGKVTVGTHEVPIKMEELADYNASNGAKSNYLAHQYATAKKKGTLTMDQFNLALSVGQLIPVKNDAGKIVDVQIKLGSNVKIQKQKFSTAPILYMVQSRYMTNISQQPKSTPKEDAHREACAEMGLTPQGFKELLSLENWDGTIHKKVASQYNPGDRPAGPKNDIQKYNG